MKQMIIHGGKPLTGEVWIGGAKNSIAAPTPAAILSHTPVALECVPHITGVDNLMNLLKEMDVKYDFKETTLFINPAEIKISSLSAGRIKSLGTSYYFTGALLGRFGKAVVDFLGGDGIGPRPIDQHTKGFGALGAIIKDGNDQIITKAPEEGLHGSQTSLAMPSVGATMNIIMASATAQGQTVINNVAKEPEIIDLVTFLNNMDAVIHDAGTETIRIDGVRRIETKVPRMIIPSRIEAETYISLAACIRNSVRIHNVTEEHLNSCLAKVGEMGIVIDADEDSLYVYPAGDLRMIRMRTGPYPGFATDLQQPVTPLLLTIKTGGGIVIDNIYPRRIRHIPELQRVGANIKVEDNIILVHPTNELRGTRIRADEIRTGASPTIADLITDDETVIGNADDILRGYGHVEEKLRKLGADVTIQDV